MMRYLMAIAIVGLSVGSAFAAPDFDLYPAGAIYNGPHAKPDISSKDAALFRTRIQEASRKSVNFSGEYSLQTWGCGTGCETGVAVNLRTGKVAFLPSVESNAGDPNFTDRFQYSANSKLLIATGTIGDDQGIYEYLFKIATTGLVPFGKRQLTTGNEVATQAPTTESGSTDQARDEDYISVLKAPFSEGIWKLTFVARSNQLAIRSIRINRGNCQVSSPDGQTGANLKFGERWSVLIKCNPIEVVVNSDHGSGKITWDN